MGDAIACGAEPRGLYCRIDAKRLLAAALLFSLGLAAGCRAPQPRPRRGGADALLKGMPDSPEEKEFRDLKL